MDHIVYKYIFIRSLFRVYIFWFKVRYSRNFFFVKGDLYIVRDYRIAPTEIYLSLLVVVVAPSRDYRRESYTLQYCCTFLYTGLDLTIQNVNFLFFFSFFFTKYFKSISVGMKKKERFLEREWNELCFYISTGCQINVFINNTMLHSTPNKTNL